MYTYNICIEQIFEHSNSTIGICVYMCLWYMVYILYVCVCICNYFYREKVKAVPEELKVLKANKHYLHATELLTITGTQKEPTKVKNILQLF